MKIIVRNSENLEIHESKDLTDNEILVLPSNGKRIEAALDNNRDKITIYEISTKITWEEK